MKQHLVGTWLGRRFEASRNQMSLLKTLLVCPEQIATLINDQFAIWMTYRLCMKGKVFVDIGAHIGSVTAGVSTYSKPRKIIAIEAMPSKAAHLKSRFPNVVVIDTALGETTGQTKFYINLKQTGFSSLVPSGAGAANQRISEITVKLSRLDDIVEDSDVDVIKIDVEGAEVGVIRGGQQILQSCRPVILFESGPPIENALGYTKDQLWIEYSKLDYVIVIPNRLPHDDRELDHAGFIEAHTYPRRTTNYFAVPREKRVEMKERARSILARSAFRPLLG